MYLTDGFRIRRVGADGILTSFGGEGLDPGENIPAAEAVLNKPSVIASDRLGNLYVVCENQNGMTVVRKISRDGRVSTTAGGGTRGSHDAPEQYDADGVPATQVNLSGIAAIAIDAAGSLYIATTGGAYNRVRKVSTNGLMNTVAGGGRCCAVGDGEAATRAYLGAPVGLAVDVQGNVYISDYQEGLIRKVSPSGIISTVAGCDRHSRRGGTFGRPAEDTCLLNPGGIAVDSGGRLFIAESGHSRVRMLTPDGASTTIAGTGRAAGAEGDDGPATSATLFWPSTLVLGTRGEMYVACSGTHHGLRGMVVRRLTPIN